MEFFPISARLLNQEGRGGELGGGLRMVGLDAIVGQTNGIIAQRNTKVRGQPVADAIGGPLNAVLLRVGELRRMRPAHLVVVASADLSLGGEERFVFVVPEELCIPGFFCLFPGVVTGAVEDLRALAGEVAAGPQNPEADPPI